MQCECHKVPAAPPRPGGPPPSGGPPGNSTAAARPGGPPASGGPPGNSTAAARPGGNSTSASGPPPSGSGPNPPVPLGYASTNSRNVPDAFVVTDGRRPMSSSAQSSGSSPPRPLPPILAQAGNLITAINNSTGGMIPRLLNRLNMTDIPCNRTNSSRPFPPPFAPLVRQMASLFPV